MKFTYSLILAWALLMTLSGCTSSHPVGSSQVRQAPDTYSQGTTQSQQYGYNQSNHQANNHAYENSQSMNTRNAETGDNSGLGTSGTGGRSSSLGSSGGSPYIPPTGGKMPANTATTTNTERHTQTR
jgi:hypothetical protein